MATYPPTQTPSRRSRNEPVDPDAVAPLVPWEQMYAYLLHEFEQGDHVSILGPTGTGKTHMALAIAEIRAYVLVVATKQRDPLVEDTIKRGYYLIPTDKLEVPYVDNVPHYKHVVYWPRLSQHQVAKLPEHHRIRMRKAHQKPRVSAALGYVDLNGHWCIVLDEGTWVYKDLRLGDDIDSALNQWRTNKASIIILGQRPAWMGRYVLSQPTHVFLFQTSNIDDAKSLGNITGANTKQVKEIVQNLDHHSYQCLYINTRTREMFRTVAPPK
jgi:energy-coupling factor transporter ATP-binding protein EcfA2